MIMFDPTFLQKALDCAFNSTGFAVFSVVLTVVNTEACHSALDQLSISEFNRMVLLAKTHCFGGIGLATDLNNYERLFNANPFSVFVTPEQAYQDTCRFYFDAWQDDFVRIPRRHGAGSMVDLSQGAREYLIEDNAKQAYIKSCQKNSFLVPAIYASAAASCVCAGAALYYLVRSLM